MLRTAKPQTWSSSSTSTCHVDDYVYGRQIWLVFLPAFTQPAMPSGMTFTLV